ncbi:hypothetical protein BC332_03155 [Capsicum chinense]|nr:hypothetical protein BC332_03155 [Capsicum chinense]
MFTEELTDDGGRDHKLLVVGHAVLVELGSVLIDLFTFTELSRSQFLKYWPLGASQMRLVYTLPEFCVALGALSGWALVSTRRVTLNKINWFLYLHVVWDNCRLNEEVDGAFGEREVFAYWRNVEDGLILPLLIDLYENSV